MTPCDLETSVPDWVIDHPVTLSLLQELGIDYCCGGKSLEYACQQKGHDPVFVLEKLRRLIADSQKTSSS